jgi:carbonic anhydrase
MIQNHESSWKQLWGAARGLFGGSALDRGARTCFIGCSELSLAPHRIAGCEAKELRVVSNLGNLIPAAGHGNRGGEAAAVESALDDGAGDIILCGHSGCLAMQALLNGKFSALPASLRPWLEHADETRRRLADFFPLWTPEEQLERLAQENVLVQLEHLADWPGVARAIQRNEVRLHAWYYRGETGELLAFDGGEQRFVPVARGRQDDDCHGFL